jgi:hypothetical protein
MKSQTSLFLLALLIIASSVANAAVRGSRRLRKKENKRAAADYTNLVSEIASSDLDKIKQRYLQGGDEPVDSPSVDKNNVPVNTPADDKNNVPENTPADDKNDVPEDDNVDTPDADKADKEDAMSMSMSMSMSL